MQWSLAAGLICLDILALPIRPVHAMQFQPVPVSAAEVVVDGRGPIVPGDTERLMQALAAVPPTGRTLLALALDSGGGNVAEAKQMVDVIHSRQLAVVIPRNSQCASACFLLLAASPRRFAATDALIGVHSASQNGSETDTSLAVTTLMARDAAELGVPPSIIGKMVETTPGRIAWLNPPDLALMHVTVYQGDALTVLRQPNPAVTQRPLTSSPPPAQASPPSALAMGQEDRRAWNAWLSGLRGEYRDGAIFAQTQMREPQPASCYGPDNVSRGDFTLGCEVARQRLAPLVAKRRSSADYASGWNAPVPPVDVVERVEQEYQGVYFCARQVAHLTLKVFQGSDPSHRRALFVFGPNDDSADVPRGSFVVEGSIDVNGGMMTLRPIEWVSQPPGYQWLGLSGRSDDGGKTFSGRVVDSSTCTRFTLARMKSPFAAR